MDIKELESFKLSDAVKFHDHLNSKLWRGQNLRPEVKDQLEIITKDFLEELGIHGLDVKDITVSGSNAAYSYTPHSDLDLHILVDMGKYPDDDVYRELFNAKKTLYNDTHDIKIHGVPVELYVQDAREPVVSLGEYSLKNDKWLRLPTKRRANFDQTATKQKYEKLLTLVELALKSKRYSKVNSILKTIKRYRQSGLDRGGEFGPENLAYKALRSQGYITKLHDLKNKLHSEVLTIETMYQNIDEAFDQPYKLKWEKSDYGDVDAIAKMDDGNYLSIMFNKGYNQDKEEAWSVEFFRNNSQEVTGEGDAQRVFATVLTAIQIFIKKYKPNKVIFSASKEVENGQNAQSRARLYDSLVQRYARAWGFRAFRADTGNKVIYELSRRQPVAELATMQYAAEKTPAVNPYGGLKDNQYRGSISEASDKKISFKIQKGNGKFSTTLTVNNSPAGIYQYDSNTGRSIAEVYPEFKGKGLGKLLVLHAIYTAAQLGLDFQEDESRTSAYDNVLDSLSSNGYIVDDDGYWYVTGEGEQYLKQSLNEASGYIPSEKEKNDPRFKTALTVDVHPDSIEKNAKAFYWKTSRAGIPPTAKPNGKIS